MSGERMGAADFTLKGVGTSGSSTARSGSNIRRSSPLSSNVALQRDRNSPSRPTGWEPYILRGRVDSHAHDGLHRTFFKTGRVAEIFLGTNKIMRDRTAASSSHRRKHEEVLQDPSRAAKESHRDQVMLKIHSLSLLFPPSSCSLLLCPVVYPSPHHFPLSTSSSIVTHSKCRIVTSPPDHSEISALSEQTGR